MGIDELVGGKREELLRIAKAHGAARVRVIGSVARGSARPDSDLDLLVDFKEQPSLLDHISLAIALEAALGRHVDLTTERGLRPEYRGKVLAEAVPL